MRSKEDAHDYRYFPDPDLLPLELDAGWADQLRQNLPELPDALRQRLMDQFGLSAYDAGLISEDRETAAWYEKAVAGRDAKLVANWMAVELFGALNRMGLELADSTVKPDQLGQLVERISDGTILAGLPRMCSPSCWKMAQTLDQVIEEKGFKQVSDTGAIETMIDTVMAENADKVEEYRGGKDKLFGFFVGQVMKASKGQANPGVVNDLLRQKLDRIEYYNTQFLNHIKFNALTVS